MQSITYRRLQPLSKKDWGMMVLSVLILFGIFLASMAYTVRFEDAGEFGMACFYAGIPHPPSYPLYALTCPIFAHLPGISPIHGIGIFSALNGALAALLIGMIVLRLTGVRWAAILAIFTIGLSNSFWSQSIIQDVYTLNAVMFFLSLWRAFEFAEKPTTSNFYILVLSSAFGLSNHWPLMTLSAIAIFMVILPQWRVVVRLLLSVHGIGIAGVVLLGLMPYLYSWLHSLSDPLISFSGPIDSWERWWAQITRKGYSGIDSAGGNSSDKYYFLLWLWRSMISEQLSWVGTVLMMIGAGNLLKKRWNVGVGLLLGVIGSSVLLVGLLGFRFDEIYRATFRPYSLTAWGIGVLLMALGAVYLYQLFGQHRRFVRYGMVSFFLIPAWLAYTNASKNWQPAVSWAHKQAVTVLNSLKPNAILLVYDDTHLPLMYLHYVEEYRPDITIYQTQSLIVNNRLTNPHLTVEKKREVYRQAIIKSDRPYYTYYKEENPFGGISNGLYFIGDRSKPQNTYDDVIDLKLFSLIQYGKDVFEDGNAWSRILKLRLATKLAELLLRLPVDTAGYAQAREMLLSRTYGQFAYADAWAKYRQPLTEKAFVYKLLEKMKPKVATFSPVQQGKYYAVLGSLYSYDTPIDDQEKIDQLEQIFLKGLSAYEYSDNSSLPVLLDFYKLTNQEKKFESYTNLYPNATRKINKKDNSKDSALSSNVAATLQLRKAMQLLKQNPPQADKALVLAEEVILYQPDSASAFLIKGGAHMMKGELKASELAFKQALKINPQDLDIQKNLAHVYLNQKRWQEALALANSVLSNDPTSTFFLNIKQKLKRTKNDNHSQ